MEDVLRAIVEREGTAAGAEAAPLLLREARQALREREERLSRLLERMREGFALHEVLLDEDGRPRDYRFLEVNAAFERLTGLRRDEVLGRTVREVLPDIQPFWIERYGTVATTGEATHFDAYAAPLGRHYEVAAYSPRPGQFATLVNDVTPRVEAEAALVQSERYLRALFEGSLDAILVADDEGRYVDANPAALEMLGVTREELLGRTAADFAADREYDFAGAWRRFLESGQMKGAFHARRPDGTVRVLDFAATANVTPGRHLSVLRDVTERTRTEAALRENEHLFQLVLETIPIGVWLVDRNGFVTYGNLAARRIWGGARYVGLDESHVYKAWRLPGGEPVGTDWSTARAVRKGVATFAEPLEIERFDGVRRIVLVSALPIRDQQQGVIGAIETNEDVTDQRRLEQQFLQAQKMEAVGRLAGGVAHDFNNLLSVILGRGAALQRLLPEGGPGRRHLDEVLAASERAAALTRQLLAFGRRQLVQRRPVHVNEVVGGMRAMLGRLIGEDVELRTELTEGMKPVLADVNQLEQVVMNLAVNARDAMPGGGVLTIATSPVRLDEAGARAVPGAHPGSYAELAVTDDGTGMDEDTIAHLFEPFFTTKEPGKGTGLGLATVYGIVEQSGGHVSVESRPGQGSTFRVRLPFTEAAVEEPEGAATVTDARHGSEILLLVEDEEALRDLVREGLEEWGYTVLAAANGAHALEVAAAHEGPIDLVITDVIMPGMHGRELVRRLAESRPGLGVLYMSGYSADVIAGQDILGPHLHYLEKPFSSTALAQRVREALDDRPGRSPDPGPTGRS